MGQEWQIYNFILNETARDPAQAENYIDIALKQRKKINSKKLSEQKYNLIKEINSVYSAELLLKSTLKNYKLLASVYKLFEDFIHDDIKFEPKEIAQAKNCITEHLLGRSKPVVETKQSDAQVDITLYREQPEVIRLLSYKIMVENFNNKYKSLDANQKRILRGFINEVTNTNNLAELVKTETVAVKEKLNELRLKIAPSKDSEVLRIKLQETVKQLDRLPASTKSLSKDAQVMILLLSHELINEIKTKLSIS